MATDCSAQLTLWALGPQQVTVDFEGGCLISDAGLLALRALDKKLGVIAELPRRFPDPRAQKFVKRFLEAILTQQVFTRRQAELYPEPRPVLLEVDAAQTQRLKILNDYLPDPLLFCLSAQIPTPRRRRTFRRRCLSPAEGVT